MTTQRVSGLAEIGPEFGRVARKAEVVVICGPQPEVLRVLPVAGVALTAASHRLRDIALDTRCRAAVLGLSVETAIRDSSNGQDGDRKQQASPPHAAGNIPSDRSARCYLKWHC